MSYREGSLACPGCGELLDPRDVGDAVIDVCPACGGVWVDWFDGELQAMVRGAPTAPAASSPGQQGSAACPRCHRPLDAERYLETRAVIHRCGDCAGAFVSREDARVLAASDRAREAPTDAWSRLATTLQRWFGWDEERR